MAKNNQTRKNQRTRGSAERDEKEGATTLSNLNVKHIGIVVQSFAVFVAISTLMGRVYSLAYHETLGIPKTEIDLTVLDYAVVSPEVTVFGVAFSLIVAAFLSSDWQRALEHFPRVPKIVAGFLIMVVGICPLVLAIAIASQQAYLDLIYFTVMTLITAVFWFSGAVVLSSGVFPDTERTDQKFALSKAVSPLLAIVIVVVGVWNTSKYSMIIGELEARIELTAAPQARIALASTSTDDALRHVIEECDVDPEGCQFRVVLTGDRFVYLRSLESESSEESLYAVPTRDIASMTYLVPKNVQ